jgi:hypothetical protein
MCSFKKILLLIAIFNYSFTVNSFSKKDFYRALSGNSVEKINQEIGILENGNPVQSADAYKGALYMKKASFPATLNEKLSLFKNGKALLENEIAKQTGNIEFRFLRLIIQENAPGFLAYNNNIQEDKNSIINGFSKLDIELKNIILEYSKQSKILQTSDLK